MAPKWAALTGVLTAAAAVDIPRTGTIDDVKHIVVYMQENRAFDHYYGRLRGVRGFNDRAAPSLSNGASIFRQPIAVGTEADGYLLPFHLEFDKTAASCMDAPEMSYPGDIGMFHNGSMDAWNTARAPGFGMSYFEREDLPFYYALADAFLIGDQYFQSTFTATNPNRFHLFTGSNGCSVKSTGGYCFRDDSEPAKGVDWETYGETLLKHNITWRVYQEQDNFDDNAFAWFDSFKEAKPGSPLYDLGMYRSQDLVKQFETDVQADKLPQVSWIVGPTALSEHARWHPADGEDLSARLIKVLQAKPEVYAKTALFFNYDEGGQFFDHHWPPTPPMSAADGKSTVTVEGELTKDGYGGVPGQDDGHVPAGNPVGMGFRVPFFIISPWTRAPNNGGLVYSEVADHTSVIKFIEQRFGAQCPNISPWRRAVAADLVNAFDFAHPDYSWPEVWPETSGNLNRSAWQCEHLPPPQIPKVQNMPQQEPGTVPSRALPYKFVVNATLVAADTARLHMEAQSTGTMALLVFDRVAGGAPRKYTVEAGRFLEDDWKLEPGGKLDLSVHGTNGFVRQFKREGALPQELGAELIYVEDFHLVQVALSGAGSCSEARLQDAAYSTPGSPWTLVAGQADRRMAVPTGRVGNWYDLHLSVNCSTGHAEWRFMGRMETGEQTTSDPAMAYPPPVQQEGRPMPPLDGSFRKRPACSTRIDRQRQKDQCMRSPSSADVLIQL